MRRIWNVLQLVNMTAGPERLPELTYLFGSIARLWVNPSTLDKLAAMGNAWTQTSCSRSFGPSFPERTFPRLIEVSPVDWVDCFTH
jgi:hypothetical protein